MMAEPEAPKKEKIVLKKRKVVREEVICSQSFFNPFQSGNQKSMPTAKELNNKMDQLRLTTEQRQVEKAKFERLEFKL